MGGGHLNMHSVFGCFGAGNWGKGFKEEDKPESKRTGEVKSLHLKLL